MIAHRSGKANTTRRTFGLKPRRDINGVSVQISPVCNRISNVDPDAKADGLIGWLIPIVDWNLLLHPHGTTHRAIYAVEDN